MGYYFFIISSKVYTCIKIIFFLWVVSKVHQILEDKDSLLSVAAGMSYDRQKVSEYGQEISQSHTADQPTAP